MNWTKDEREFSDLFRAARKEQTRLKSEASPGDPADRAATAFGEARGWPWAKDLVEASRLERTGADGVLPFLDETRRQAPERFQPIVHVTRGCVLYVRREFDDAAIAAIHKALDEPDDDTPRLAWAKLSLVFQPAERMDEAASAYKKALASPEPTGDRFLMVDFRGQGPS